MKKRIGAAIMFFFVLMGGVVIPTSPAFAAPVVDTTDYNDYEARLQDCGFMGDSNLTACLVEALYYLVLTPSAWFARVTGELFDYFVQYSLDTNSYRGNDNFIERGWSIVRDIGNVLFIFALLYIAITHILQAGTSGTKKFLINLIIAALLINFSLFFSRVIIDGGNVLARAFYNNIEIPNDDNLQYHTISQGIVMHVNPQRLLGSELFTPKYSSDPDVPEGKVDNGYAALILGMAAAVNIVMGITFLSVALLFVGRVVGLWFLMIFSPFALASIAVPNSGKIFGQFSWGGWIDQILKLSFMAPVFMFFLFLLIMFLQVIFHTNVSDADKTTVQWLLDVMIPFIMVIFILNKAKKIAADLAGEAGTAVKSAFGTAANFALGGVGLVGGGALSATAFAGRQVLGRAASATLDSKYFQNRVRLNALRATTSEKKAQEARTEAERRKHLSDASRARAAATRNAIMVKQLGGAKKSSFDVRRSDVLQKKIIGSKLGKATIGSGGYAQMLGSELFDSKTKLKLGFGKGTDTSFAKSVGDNSKAVTKDRLTTGQLYDKEVIEEPSNKTLKDIKAAAENGLGSRDEVLKHIDKYLREIKDSEFLTDSEKREKTKSAETWKDIANSAVDDGGMRTINTGKGTVGFVNEKGEDDLKTVEFSSPDRSKVAGFSSKDAYAEETKAANLGLSEKDRQTLVEALRKGEKAKDEKDDLLAKFAKYAKDADGSADKEKGENKEKTEKTPDADKGGDKGEGKH